MKRSAKGQGLLEYALIVALLVLLASTLLFALFGRISASAWPHSYVW